MFFFMKYFCIKKKNTNFNFVATFLEEWVEYKNTCISRMLFRIFKKKNTNRLGEGEVHKYTF